jgi:acyl dehydratase
VTSTFSYEDLEVLRNRTFDEIAVGDRASIERTLTAADIQLFAAMSGDINPQHIDPEFAASTRFHGVIAHGMWGGALISAVLGTRLPGPGTVLAAVETVNPHMPATVDAAALCKMADRGQIGEAVVDGPLAFDNAVSAAAARTKGIVSDVAGSADILVVPDLESGNMLAKQLEHLGGAASAGIVLGARVPIVLTSRADPRESRIASCAVALVAARRLAQPDAMAPGVRKDSVAPSGTAARPPAALELQR